MAKRVTKTTSSKQTAAARRTKKTATPIKKAPTKKGVTKGSTTPQKTTTTPKTPVSKGSTTPKKRTPRAKPKEFVRISENASKDSFSKMWERVKNGEIKWGYYAIDGNVGYHYYEIL